MIERLRTIVESFPEKRVLVIGDIMADEYIRGSVSRVSPEAPVPVVLEKKREIRPGGALNVINNLISLNAKPLLSGVTGKDSGSRFIHDFLKENRISTEGVIEDPSRATTVKTRIIGNNQQIARVDAESSAPIDAGITKKAEAYIDSVLQDISAVIISDYNKGFVNEAIYEKILSLKKKNGVFTAVDPQIKNYRLYKDASLITPNHHEAGSFVGIAIEDGNTLRAAAEKIMSEINPEILLVTLGENGMMLCGRGGEFTSVPTIARHVYDVTGAGDTVITVFTLAMICGASPYEAAIISNIAAGYVVGEAGTMPVPLGILKERLTPEYIPL